MELTILRCTFEKKISIHMRTKVFVKNNSYFSLDYDGRKHYFKVNKITTSDADTIKIDAKEVGHWREFFRDDFDIRELVYEKVTLIEDDETIEMINRESRYC